MDICLVFDTTGSMSDKIDGLVSCMTGFVDRLAELGLDWRITTVPFGDLTVEGDRVVGRLPFVHSVIAAKALIRRMPRFSGGTNDGESSIEAMRAALSKPWRDRAVKILVLLTDEPAVGAERAQGISQAIRRNEAICFCVTPDTAYYQTWSGESGGSWVQISANMDTGALVGEAPVLGQRCGDCRRRRARRGRRFRPPVSRDRIRGTARAAFQWLRRPDPTPTRFWASRGTPRRTRSEPRIDVSSGASIPTRAGPTSVSSWSPGPTRD